jgi:hypothetical protein
MKETANIELNKEEANLFLELMHIAVKNIGLEDGGKTANNAIYFTNKIKVAFKEEPKEEK